MQMKLSGFIYRDARLFTTVDPWPDGEVIRKICSTSARLLMTADETHNEL
jgi:hypothetical protein